MPSGKKKLVTPADKLKQPLEVPLTGDGFRTSAKLHADMFMRTKDIDSDRAVNHLMQAMTQVVHASLLDHGLIGMEKTEATNKEEGK